MEVATAPAAAEAAPVKPPATPAEEPVKSRTSPAADETQSAEVAPCPATEGVALLDDVARKAQVASTSCREYLLHACLARHTMHVRMCIQDDWDYGYTLTGGKAGPVLQGLHPTHGSPLSTAKDAGCDPSLAATCASRDAASDILWRGQGVNVKVCLPCNLGCWD